jgi:DNA-directed RNA polymerase subunit M/transcription elongation factor TFIIS
MAARPDLPSEADVEHHGGEFRTAVARLLHSRLGEVFGADPPHDLALLGAKLEEECHAAALNSAGLGNDSAEAAQTYARAYHGLWRALPEPFGQFLEAPLALHLIDGRVEAAEAVTPRVYEACQEVGPRVKARALLHSLFSADRRFEPEFCRSCAREIEQGAYQASLRHCRDSEDSYQRQWDCEMFVNVYSARIGSIAANLDPFGSVGRALGGSPEGGKEGAWLPDRLLSGDVAPAALGGMSEEELCPSAGAAERALVARRLGQKVEEKTSTMFRCPRCKQRRHTYRQVQIGAADEPSTIMCTCLNCGENFEGRS